MKDGDAREERPGPARRTRRTRRRLLPQAGEARSGPSERPADVQALLAHALETIARETRCARGAAWARDADGRTAALALWGESVAPAEGEVEMLAALGSPADLGHEPPESAAARFAERSGFSAVAAVGGLAEPLALLLLGGGADPAGRVRPRTLAALAAAAARLEAPLAAAAAHARLVRLDGEVRRLDRLAALGGLVAEIVHEIRNPLVSVKTFLQLLPEREQEPEFRDRFREVAAEELRRIERLLDLVLAHARPSPPVRENDRSAVGAACDAVAQLVSHRAADLGVQVALAPSDPTLHVSLSNDALRQVVLNLVVNALDVTPRGGTVRIALQAQEDAAELCVEDEGPGVPEPLRGRIFEPFVSSKSDAPGGLGLAISRRIVEEAGGSIAALPRPGRGFCFRVWLPRA